jgi:hypothetical protein
MYTPWFLSLKFDPVRPGTYEVCSSPGSDVARCRWSGKSWRSASVAGRIAPVYWRGLSEPPLRIVKAVKMGTAPPAASASDSSSTNRFTNGRTDKFLTTPCQCAGENENCFRCGGWGYIDSISKGRSSPVGFIAGGASAPGKARTAKKSAPNYGRALEKCPYCGVPVARLQKHISKAHSGTTPPGAESQRKHLPSNVGQSKRPRGPVEPVIPGIHQSSITEQRLDATRDYYAAYRDNGQFGSHASHDGYDEESKS